MRYSGGREKACHIRLRQQIAALSATFIAHTSRSFFFKKLDTPGVMRGYILRMMTCFTVKHSAGG